MFNVNNKKALRNLSNKSFKDNKTRNMYVIVAITLTCILFTSIATMGLNVMKSSEEQSMRSSGSKAHAVFKELNEEQYYNIVDDKSIVESGYEINIGIVQNDELRSRQTEIGYVSNDYVANSLFAFPTTGKLPIEYNEIALDEITLKSLGVEPQLGEKVTLEYLLNGELVQDNFVLSGYWEGDKATHSSQAWVSDSYTKPKLDTLIEGKNSSAIGNIFLYVNYKNSRDIEGKTLKVISNSGYAKDDILFGINWAYIGNNRDNSISTILGVLIIFVIIILCGYLIITNIFYISISKDINYYGLLKTIGVTNKQIKFMIRKQAMNLCLIGIPIGLCIGYFIGTILTPLIFRLMTYTYIQSDVNITVFILSATFTIITVLLSVRKPANIASRVSPIEANGYSDATDVKIKSRKSKKASIFNMALRNVTRNKKKLAMVSISIALGLIVLNTAYSLANSFDMEKYMNQFIKSDFMISDIGLGNVATEAYNKRTITPQVIKDIQSQDGIEHLSSIYLTESEYILDDTIIENTRNMLNGSDMIENHKQYSREILNSGKTTVRIYGMDEYGISQIDKYEGELDYNKLKTGNYVITTYSYDEKYTYYNVGDTVIIYNKSYEVLAVVEIPYIMTPQVFPLVQPNFILAEDEYLKITSDNSPLITMVDVDDNHIDEIDSFLNYYFTNVNTELKYNSRKNVYNEYKGVKDMIIIVGATLSFILAFIGIINFINTISTSIISRKEELVILKSIGGTNKQIQKMLIIEGCMYMVLSMILVLTIGYIIMYGAVNMVVSNSWITMPCFSVLPSILCILVLVLVCVTVPVICYNYLKKESYINIL